MTHKQWFNNVLHLHPVHEEGAKLWKRVDLKENLSSKRDTAVIESELRWQDWYSALL